MLSSVGARSSHPNHLLIPAAGISVSPRVMVCLTPYVAVWQRRRPVSSRGIKTHLSCIEIGMLLKMLQEPKSQSLSSFLLIDFCRVTFAIANAIWKVPRVLPKAKPMEIGGAIAETYDHRSLSDENHGSADPERCEHRRNVVMKQNEKHGPCEKAPQLFSGSRNRPGRRKSSGCSRANSSANWKP